MKSSQRVALCVLPFALAALFTLSACGTISTIESRSKERAAAFTGAAPGQQQRMREGWIDAGFTPDMVYVALDKPDKTATAENGVTEIWIYENFDTPFRAFGGGVKVTVQAGSALPGMGVNPTSSGATGKYISAGVKPDLSAVQVVDPVSTLYVLFRQGKVAAVKITKV